MDSGGDPDFIPALTYEQFLEFHKTYYHPSNCRIFLYGNVSPRKNLEFLDDRFLKEFEKRDVDSRVPLQENWTAPRVFETTWPSGEEEDEDGKSSHLLNWKTVGPEDPVRSLSYSIMTEMLMGNSGAPLQKILHESDLGDDISPVSGMDFDLNEAVFSIGLRGSDPDKKEAFRELIFSSLKEIAEKGFPEDLKESCMRLVEFRAREIKGGGPFGLRLLKKALKGWNYDLPPVQTLRFDSVMKEVRRRAEEPGYFESLLKEGILNNPHYSLVTVKPDPESRNKQEEALRKEMAAIEASLSEEDEANLKQENAALKTFQEKVDTPEERQTIPTLSRDDIPRTIQKIPYHLSDEKGIKVLRQGIFTNGILYSDLAFDLSGVDEDLYPYLPLFCRALSGTGLPGIPYDVVTRDLALKTGGFGASLEASCSLSGSSPDRYLYVRLKMLEEQSAEALELAGKLLLQADFDNTARLDQIMTEMRNDMKASLIPGGHSYVSLRTNRALSKASALEDDWFGISQLQFLNELTAKKDKPFLLKLSSLMKQIRKEVFNAEGLVISLTMDESVMNRHSPEILNYWQEILPVSPGKRRRSESGDAPDRPVSIRSG